MDKNEVIKRLLDFGYTYSEKDADSLEYAVSKTKWHILNKTNLEDIPEGLKYVAMDMACAELLKLKKSFGQLEEIAFERIAKSIVMGDTNVTFADDASPEKQFDLAIHYLLTGHEDDFIRYRKMVW